MLTKLIILGLAALAVATPIEDVLKKGTLEPKEKQIYILKLLNNILQPVMYKDIEELGTNYKLEDNVDQYTQTDVVKRLVNKIRIGVLPRGEIFTIHIDRQMEEVVDMFHVLYYAKDFATFLKTASWMRINLNEGMFVYALTVAVRHREDCKDIVLPPPYEIYPYYFVRADVIQKAYMLKMKNGMLDRKLADFYGIRQTEKDVYIIDENPFDTRVLINEEDQLRYFTEDIGLNTYYYYFHVDYPFWMKEDLNERTEKRNGELVQYIYQQILARYYLERLSNNLGEIPTICLEQPIKQGYWPWLLYHTGIEIPARLNNYVVNKEQNHDIIRLVENYETTIREAIITGHVTTPDGTKLQLTKNEDVENLYKILRESTTHNKNYREVYTYMLVLMEALMGLNTLKSDKYFVVPTVLDNYQTALRDPVFYQLQKRLVENFLLFKRRLPSYTKEELTFPGVKIDSVAVDKLVTYFEDNLVDMTNAVILNEEELQNEQSTMTIMVRKRRLTNKPFKITVQLTSDKVVNSVVRIFLGPKEDRNGRLIDINKNRLNFVEIDSFLHKLTTGKNTIVRNSNDMLNVIGDRMTTRELWTKINSGTDIKELLRTELKNTNTGFPRRLLLPKGRVGGMKMMIYIIVTPLRPVEGVDLTEYNETKNTVPVVTRSTVTLDKMPLGFPLDRQIDVTRFFSSNMKFVDVTIFHKQHVSDMQTRWNQWVLNDYCDRTSAMTGGETYFFDATTDKSQETGI